MRRRRDPSYAHEHDSQIGPRFVSSKELVNPHTSTIVVAAKDLAFGKALDKSMLLQVDWPTKLLPPGAFSKISELVGKQGRRVVLSKITKGEPILKAKGFETWAASFACPERFRRQSRR